MSWKKIASPEDVRVEMRVRAGDNFHWVKVTPDYWLAQKVVVESTLLTDDVLFYPEQSDQHVWREEFFFGGGPGGGTPLTQQTELQHPDKTMCGHSVNTEVSAGPTHSFLEPNVAHDVHSFNCK